MPFLSIKIIPPASIVARRFERLRKKIPLVSRQRLFDAAVAIRKKMKEPGRPPVYPIQWDTVRQRKAFFASDGFGRGIPTRRTGDYLKAWQVIRREDGYDVGNPLSHSKYIGSTARSTRRQSRIHKGRWNLFKVVKDRVIKKLPKTVKRVLKEIARQEGFGVKD
jgi:hypothetical protein